MAGSSPPNDRGHHGSNSSRHRIRLLCSENQPSTGTVWDTPLYRDVLSNHPTLFSASQNGEMRSRGRKCLGSMAKKAFLIFTPRTFENPPSLPSPLYFLSPTSHPPSLLPHPSSPKFGCSILLTPQDCHKLLNHECAFFSFISWRLLFLGRGLYYLFWDRVLPCVPGWLYTHGLGRCSHLRLPCSWNYTHVPLYPAPRRSVWPQVTLGLPASALLFLSIKPSTLDHKGEAGW